MTEQDLIGKTATIVGIDTSPRTHDFQDFCAHICLDIEGGPRVFVEVLRDGGLRLNAEEPPRVPFRAELAPPMCPGCGNHTLGDDGVCRRSRCGYGKPDGATS